jgi:hypothetical protein
MVCIAETAYRAILGKDGRKRPLARLTNRWEDNIKVDLKWNERVLTG